jgi:Domain of unknown function (DUF4304)
MGMNKSATTEKLDRLLVPLGFERRRRTWNRRRDLFVDVVDIQRAGTSNHFTINAGVFDPEVHSLIWDKRPPEFVQEIERTARARIGSLIDRYDRWWDPKSEDTPDEVADLVEAYVLPFLKRMNNRAVMAERLHSDYPMNQFPLTIISLAILKGLLGELPAACRMLNGFPANDAWSRRAAEVARRLQCPGEVFGAT